MSLSLCWAQARRNLMEALQILYCLCPCILTKLLLVLLKEFQALPIPRCIIKL